MVSAGIAVAFMCGGMLMEFARPVFDSLALPFVMGQKLRAYHILFMLSGLIRMFALSVLLNRVKETNSKTVKELLRALRQN